MLHEEKLLHEIDAIQISTRHRYASTCFKTRELLLEFCKQEHILLPGIPVQFSPDYERTRISIENIPIELPDEDVYDFLSVYATPIRKTYYTGKRHNNKYYTTGTIVYQCMHLKQHLPRHVYKFGRYLRIRCNSQPIPAFTTTSENNGNTPLQDNQQTAPQTQENIAQPMLPQNTPTPQPHKKKTRQKRVTNVTQIPQPHNTPDETQKQQQKPIQQTTPIPQSHVTPDETNRQQQQPTQQTQQKPQKDNIQTQPAEQQLSDSESDTDSSDSDLKTIPQPTLIPNGK